MNQVTHTGTAQETLHRWLMGEPVTVAELVSLQASLSYSDGAVEGTGFLVDGIKNLITKALEATLAPRLTVDRSDPGKPTAQLEQ